MAHQPRRFFGRRLGTGSFLVAPESLEQRLAFRTPNDVFMQPPVRPGSPPNPQWNMEKIQALQAWDLFSGNKRNVVAVMDYGIDFGHEDFGASPTVQGNLWDRGRVFADFARRGYDEINGPWTPARPQPEAATKPAAGDYQGNHAAGIIGAVTNNRLGVSGINWQTQLYSSKIVDGGKLPTIPVIRRAIDHIIQIRTSSRDEQLVRAVAFGYSSDRNFGNPMPEFQRLGAPLGNKGILVTVPAGDLGPRRTSYPAVYGHDPGDNILIVGATDQNDVIWSGNSNRDKIDIYAPGVSIRSVGASTAAYPVETGTRQAAAHVAGAISLIYEAARVNNVTIGWSKVKEGILAGADPIPGGIRLNVMGALKYLNLDTRPPVDKAVISLAGGSVTEGNGGLTDAIFTVSLDRTFTSPLTVQCVVTDGTATLADKDYLPVGANGLVDVTIPAGQKTATFAVPVGGDFRVEPNETIKAAFVDLADGYEVAVGSAEVTIVNDDLGPQVSLAGPVSVVEGTGGTRIAQVRAVLSAPSNSVVSAVVQLTAGTAIAGTDYVVPVSPLQVVFAPGQVSQVVNLTIVGDAVVEPNETFTVALTSAVNATVGATPTAVVTIVDDDSPVISVASAVRGALVGTTTSMTFLVTLSRASATPVSVDYSAIDGTAVNGVDYTLAAGTLTFAPGERSKAITVTVAARRSGAYPRSFSLRLSNPVNAGLPSGAGFFEVRGTIA